MEFNLDTVLAQKRELDRYADDLREAGRRLIRHKNSLDRYWAAKEIGMIDEVIERIDRRLNRTADELNEIGIDMLKVYRQEEERVKKECETSESRNSEQA